MARSSKSGGGGQPQPVVLPDLPSNAAIIPVQLLNTAERGHATNSPPTLASLPEVEFEDCSSAINLPLLSRNVRQVGTPPDASVNGLPESASDDVTFVSMSNGSAKANGKQRAPHDPESSNKRVRLDEDSYICLASTICRFSVLVHNAHDWEDVKAIQRVRPGDCLLRGISNLQIVSRDGQEEGRWMKRALQLHDVDGVFAVSLPIVDTDMVPASRQPHRFTNGSWLEAAVLLSGGRVGEKSDIGVRVGASLVSGEGAGAHSNRFTMELHVSVHLSLSAFSPASSPSPRTADLLHRLMRFCFPSDEAELEIRGHTAVTASLVYSLLPSSQLPSLDELQPSQLNPTLFPFQKRSVNFLLGREGKRIAGWNGEGKAVLEDLQGVMTHRGNQELGLWWHRVDDSLLYNPVMGTLTRNVEETQTDNICGGILAEEMGLGKTVEVLALVLLNTDEGRSHLPSYYDAVQEVDIFPTKTTLIVAPETLRQQWLDEISLHAPDLRTFSYLGYREASRDVPAGMEWCEFARNFDIIVASFDTLRKEINVARKAPNRSRRYERKYERPRSLLVQLAFHRVIMDEVQLVGHSSAAETVSMIHRHHSLAVSGTPVKMVTDLKSLFFFLRVLTPATERHWERLQSTALIPSLAACFGMLATRHTKRQVGAEMTLPPQTRVLVPVNFTAIESAFYRDIYSRALQVLGIEPTSYSTSDELLRNIQSRFIEDMSQVRGCLVSLRQACTHPQIAGSYVRSGHYAGAGGTLATSNSIRSMDEVLTIMIEGTRADLASLWQNITRRQINRAVLLLQDKGNEARLVIAREMLSAIANVVQEKTEGVEEDIRRASYIGPLYKFDVSDVKDEELAESEGSDEAAMVNEADLMPAFSTGSKSQAEREREHEVAERKIHRSRHKQSLTSRWRFFMEQLHRVHHFLGNVYFQIGEAERAVEAGRGDGPKEDNITKSTEQPSLDVKEALAEESDKAGGEALSPQVAALKKLENEAYDRAEEVRQAMLKESRKGVEIALVALDRSPVTFDLEELATQIDLGSSGIVTALLFDRLNAAQKILNAQAEVIFKWRDEIVERLRKPISRDVSDEDENDDQYQENLDAQSEAEALTEMYRVLLNEREFFLAGVRIEGSTSKPALFVELERQLKTQRRLAMQQAIDPENENVLRQVKNAPTAEQVAVMKLQLRHFEKLDREKRESLGEEVEQPEENGHSDDDMSLGRPDQAAAGKRRQAPRPQLLDDSIALETIARELREVLQKSEGREEAAIARVAMNKVRSMAGSQKAMCEKLKREQLLLMGVFNARSAYFKHIQLLSDHVGDIETTSIARETNGLEREEVLLKAKAESAAGRLRYLCAIEEEEGAPEEKRDAGPRSCFICTEPLVRAVVFNTCGHSTCESCFKSWTQKRGQCPMCKTRVTPRDVYRVTYGADGKGKRREVAMPQAEKRKRQQETYNVISEELVQSMAVMPIRSALGSKLDLLTRHLLYLEHTRPGTKSLIFTSFARGINLVGDALRLNNIKFVTMDHGGQRGGRVVDTFKYDSNVNVLLLHAEAQSSGLNLTCAENIFLLEPLVNHSIELQAIGRVHRIGQSRETTVYVYQVNDTVEERIVHLATERGQSLITRENCVSMDLEDAAAMVAKTQEDKGRSGSVRAKEGEFVASVDEVFRCLFDGDEAPKRATTVTKDNDGDEELDRQRRERVAAIEKRQALESIERERAEQHR